jgi:hypothetical protein
MEEAEFTRRLGRAVDEAVAFARTMVAAKLPDTVLFEVSGGVLTSGEPAPPGHVKFLGGRVLHRDQLKRLTAPELAGLLWINGMVPRWVNVAVEAADKAHTFVRIKVSTDLVSDVTDFEKRGESNPPFRIRGPQAPRHWKSVEENGRFRIPSRPLDKSP